MDKPSDPYFAIPEFFAGNPTVFAIKDDDVQQARMARPTANIRQIVKNFSPLLKNY